MTVTIFLLQVVQDFWPRTRIVPQPVVIIDARIAMKRHGVGMRAAFGSMLLFFLVETSYKGGKLTGDASETGESLLDDDR
ncbi:hypothetical protein ACLK19_12475 [Escherichia coli]